MAGLAMYSICLQMLASEVQQHWQRLAVQLLRDEGPAHPAGLVQPLSHLHLSANICNPLHCLVQTFYGIMIVSAHMKIAQVKLRACRKLQAQLMYVMKIVLVPHISINRLRLYIRAAGLYQRQLSGACCVLRE